VRAVSVLATLVGMFPMLAACGRVPAAANLGINEQDCTVSSTKLELFFIASADVSEMTR
jgi:hypothetical protein